MCLAWCAIGDVRAYSDLTQKQMFWCGWANSGDSRFDLRFGGTHMCGFWICGSVRRSTLEEEEKQVQWQLPVFQAPAASSIDYLQNEAVGMISLQMTPP